jgi:hypothetical protein
MPQEERKKCQTEDHPTPLLERALLRAYERG